MHLTCPVCASTNRVSDERLHDEPVCGRCGAPLMPTEPIELDDGSLPRYLANTDLPVVVDFWADWCGPCKMMAPHFAAAAKQMPDVRFAKVNSDNAPAASGRFAIRSIPTLILFQAGKERARLSGAVPTRELMAWVTSHLSQGAR
ncbi:Thioredoxin C-3 [Burkholderiales bacterium]|nr:Thioredoxin C-3 [Burkholderiales bacterium]